MTTSSVTVATRAELQAALAQAKAGDTILLAGGDYGTLTLNGRRDAFLKFDGPVTIGAADPGNPPVFSGLDVRDTKGLSFQGLHFDYAYQDGQPIWHKPFIAWNNSDISFIGNRFTGDVARGLTEADNGFPTGFGLQIRGSQNVTVSDNDISGFFRGLVVAESDALVVTGNELHGIRMDGMNFSAIQGVLIEGNELHNFARSMGSADHSDMIQFWTNGTTRPSTDIVIRNNILDLGDGHYTQSIFMRNDMVDRGFAGAEMFYRNVLIEGNVIVNAHMHGIHVGETAGLVIRNNSVLTADGATEGGATSGLQTPRIAVAPTSQDVTIVQNVTSAVAGFSDQSDWHVAQNVLVQKVNPNAPGFYEDVFITSSLGNVGGRHAFIARPDSEIAKLEAGASATRAPLTDAGFTVSAREHGAAEQVFDASVMLGKMAKDAQFLWDFGDGKTATGSIVTHTFTHAGSHAVTLQVKMPDGALSMAQARVDVHAADLLRMGSDGHFGSWQGNTLAKLAGFTPTEQGGLQLGGAGVAASVARDVIAPMLHKRDVSISFDLDADRAGATGEIFRLHNSLTVSVDARGALDLRAWSSEGEAVRLTGTGTPVNTGQTHAIDIRLNEGRLSLWVDDKMLGDAAFAGTFADQGRHDLTFGNLWHDASRFFKGQISDFSIRLDSAAASPVGKDLIQTAQGSGHVPPYETESFDDILSDMSPLPDPLPESITRAHVYEPALPELPAAPLRAANVQLGDAGVTQSLSRDMIQTLFTDRELDISFSLATNGADLSGEVFRVHNALVVSVDSRGAVMVRAWSSEGEAVRLVGTGANIATGAVQDVDIRLADGKLSLWVNGDQRAETAFNGTFRNDGKHDLTFGNPWHSADKFVDAELSRFDIVFDAHHQIDAFSTWASLSDAPLV